MLTIYDSAQTTFFSKINFCPEKKPHDAKAGFLFLLNDKKVAPFPLDQEVIHVFMTGGSPRPLPNF